MDYKQLPAMISLLDDSDAEVVSIVEAQLLGEGISIVPELEQAWFSLSEGPISGRLAEIISEIQHRDLCQDFEEIWSSNPISLLKIWICLSRIQTPNLTDVDVRLAINELKLDVWTQFGSLKDPVQQMNVLNDVLFRQHQFQGNSSQYHAIENSLIHETLKRKLANPISLSMLYIIVGQSLGLPVFGVNLPQHFIVAYCEMQKPPLREGIYEQELLRVEFVKKPLFYINPFSKGQIFKKESLDAFLKVVDVNPQEMFYMPCDEREIAKRVLRNMHHSYGQADQSQKQSQVRDLMRIAGMEGEWPLQSDDE
jgi:regulator of sirC expression with transglutaminase-like and TPR domain